MLQKSLTTTRQCIRISIHPMLRFITPEEKLINIIRIFQYIPCYGLSNIPEISIELQWKFQYIPCYGLSMLRPRLSLPFDHFNTSHVTVYHLYEIAVIFATSISIHPMLRFIGNQGIFHCNRT